MRISDWSSDVFSPDLFVRMHEYCLKNSRSTATDVCAKRMTKNYAALLLAWSLVVEFVGIEEQAYSLRQDLIKEMNQHIADTVSDREPFIWILEKLSNEISRRKFEHPIDRKSTRLNYRHKCASRIPSSHRKKKTNSDKTNQHTI